MIKRLILAVAAIAIFGINSNAQRATSRSYGSSQFDILQNQADNERALLKRYQDSISVIRTWSHTRYQNIGLICDETQTSSDGTMQQKSDWGFSVQLGNSFMFPSRPIAGLLKFGFDITWLDLSFVKYKGEDIYYPASRNGQWAVPDWLPSWVNDNSQFTAGAAVGFSVHLAPFAHLGAALQPLRFQAFGRFVPSYSGIIMAESGDEYVVSGTFMPAASYGLAVGYKCLGLGLEMRNGEGKYDLYRDPDNKVTIKNKSTRLFVSFHF